MKKRYFLYQDNNENKIWNIYFDNKSVEIETGILGLKPQKNLQEFLTINEAETFFNDEINKKIFLNSTEISEEYIYLSKKAINIMGHLDEMGYAKEFYTPLVRENTNDSIISSKFGGRPYIIENGNHATCSHCNNPLTLFVQLNLDSMDKKIKDCFGIYEGMIQFFYCLSCDYYENDDYTKPPPLVKSPPSVIYIESKDIKITKKIETNEIKNIFPEKIIYDWEYRGYEYPYEYEGLGDISIASTFKISDEKKYTNKLPESFITFLYHNQKQLDIFINYSQYDEDSINCLLMSDFLYLENKIGGKPYWVQIKNELKCPDCKEELSIIMQINSDENISHMFGDGGVGHIYICKNHKNKGGYFYYDCC